MWIMFEREQKDTNNDVHKWIKILLNDHWSDEEPRAL